jgi:ATP-dependent helicase/nuclease subunit B
MNPGIAHLLALGFTLVTPIKRLSRYLQYQYAAMQVRSGQKTWETPDILPWDGWLQRTWQEISARRAMAGMLLSSAQQQLVWQQCIQESRYGKMLLQPVNTARQAMQAWSLCQNWQLPVFPGDIYLNEDAYAFKVWADAYQLRCQANGWIDEAVLAGYLTGQADNPFANKKIVLLGFDEFTPRQQSLVNHIRQTGDQVIVYPLETRAEKIFATGFTDYRAEIRAAALWARNKLDSGPDTSIGIVVPNLHTLHSHITNCFDDVLSPGSILVNADQSQRLYSVSLGLPLIRYPAIDSAMLILGLGNHALPLDEFSSLLRSPFITAALAESQQRAKFDAYIRANGESRLTFKSLQNFSSNKYIRYAVPYIFVRCCNEFLNELPQGGKKLPASEWAKVFSSLLKIFNWPGDRLLDSSEFQTVTEWQLLLGKFAALDMVSPLLSYSDALLNLRQLLMNSGFQPETPEVPIQILGMNGAASMQFDHLWIMGLHEEVWPARAEPNPFIPVNLQRNVNMPDASAENKLAQAIRLTDSLINSSPDTVLSFPLNDKERPLRPSALIKKYLDTSQAHVHNQNTDYAAVMYASRRTENIEDSQAPAIPVGEAASGGTSLFRDQAACPFRAFARHRLHAEGLKSKDIGLDAIDRGNIIHEVMHQLWNRLGSHATLLKYQRQDFDVLISNVITGTINKFRKKYPLTFTDRFTQLESERLQTLIYQWLVLERERQPFSVKHCELLHTFRINDIEIRTRIDRIDELADGRYVIIDYKTGDPKIMAWFSSRPDEPQLPLYAISTDGEIAAVVFARIKRGEIAYIGLSAKEGLLPGVKTVAETVGVRNFIPDWETLISQWQESLTDLAVSYREGIAVVDPKDVNSCLYCDLHALCRIYEKRRTSVIGE